MPPGSGFKCDIRKIFAGNLSNWRRERNIPLKQVSTELGFSVATISKWERGERFPLPQNIDLFVEYTGQPLCHFMCAFARLCHGGGCLLTKSPKG
jgi:transcriptional regulator with XRE-family HTH domain